ncbi:MAG TPA: two-component regulator propeller domain-containing protein, partial [Edaphobacter sp.]|nr:two-component regulator propeller domain-containing protein [Edaphobacter sp.]
MSIRPGLVRLLRSAALWAATALSLASSPAHPQNIGNLGHQSWSTENGLPQNSVHQVFQSRDGYIWIATEGGISRFNGIDFSVFNQQNTAALTTDDICCFAQPANGTLWIGTADGLLQYEDGRFRRYSSADGLPSAAILSLAAAGDGSLYVLTGNGLATFDGHRFSPLQLPALPSTLARAPNGSLWFASPAGAFQYREGHAQPLSLPDALPKETIEALGPLPNAGLWLRTRSSLTLIQD